MFFVDALSMLDAGVRVKRVRHGVLLRGALHRHPQPDTTAATTAAPSAAAAPVPPRPHGQTQ